jgi:hypothetical protein
MLVAQLRVWSTFQDRIYEAQLRDAREMTKIRRINA